MTATDCIEIYPNPFTDFVIIDGDFADYQIEILNAGGQLVANFTNASSPLKINLNDLGAGVYFISLQSTLHSEASVYKILKN